MMRTIAAAALILVGLTGMSFARPAPGDVFREYMWWNEGGDAGGSLRVGGKHGDEHPDRGWAHDYINAAVVLEHDFDLEHATAAEVVIEKILCHDGTRGLAIEINGNSWIQVPEADAIPAPQWEYQHHIYPIVPVPLSQLKSGKGNQFRLRVDPEHPWKWPQNLIYGVHFRIYYDPAKKPHPTGRITSLASGARLGRSVPLEVEASSPAGGIRQVDYIGHYEDVNYEGDGLYTQWHYHFFHGRIMNHIGTATEAPYRVTWDTSWVPDQKEPMMIAARITDGTGMICITPAVENLSLDRAGFSVELCKPYDIPRKWVTRSGEHQEHFNVTGDLSRAVAAQLVWSSWSPGYMRGISINGTKVFDSEGPHYQYYFHRVPVSQMNVFKPGVNALTTGKTPLIDGHMVHGMEVNWPGIMVLIQYAGDVPFKHATVDDSVKDPWAKILADIDGDGFLDIVIGGRSGPLVWYRYPDWTKAIIADGGYKTVDGEAGDIDGDGDLDIVMGGLLWYENPRPQADPAKGPWKAHRVADHGTHDLELADLDKDGDLDIVTRDQSDFGAKAGDKVYLWRQDKGDTWTHRILPCPHGEGLALGDIDRDGDQDVVIGGIWFENPGSILDGDWQPHKFCDWHPSATVQVADINSDGRPDVVLSPSELAGNSYRVSWFEAPADPRQGSWTEHIIADPIECVIHGLVTADFNGDGAVDVAMSEMHQGKDPDEVVVFLSRNVGTTWQKQVLSAKGSHYIRAGDIGSDGDIDLLGANWSGAYQPVELWENQSDGTAWWDDKCRYRVAVHVSAAGAEREDQPVEAAVDFTELLRRLGSSEPVNTGSIRLVEVDSLGDVIGEPVIVQFDKDAAYDAKAIARGTLTFLLPRTTQSGGIRTFHLYFKGGPESPSSSVTDAPVRVADDVDHEGQASFKVSTPGTTYYYHKRGAGFASMEDRAGNDWLSYNPGEGPVSNSGSGGKYRGIPNMVHPEGHFHPGGDKCSSRLVAAGPVKVGILSESDDGHWACRWDIFPQYARMTVLKTSHPYWFLYEGTPGGRLEEDSDYCVRSDGTRTAASERWTGDLSAEGETAEWLYFGDGRMNRVLFLIHHADDEAVDSYWPMNKEMTVFGFGRDGLNKHMTQVPDRFTIGFCEKADFAAVARTVRSIYRPLAVAVGDPQMRRQ